MRTSKTRKTSKSNLALTLVVALASTILGLCALSPTARSDSTPDLASTSTSTSTPTPHFTHATHEAEAEPQPDRLALEVDRLAAHLETVMSGWSPAPRELAAVSVEDLARDFAAAALDPASPRFDGDSAGARAGTLLAALAYFEGARFAAYVDRGLCDDPAWRASVEGRAAMRRWGDCDHGHAFSLFQIHEGDLWLGDHCPLFGMPEHVTADKLASRPYAARLALCLAHRSLSATGTLAGYTGEDPGLCPKAEVRLNFAVDEADKHPLAALP